MVVATNVFVVLTNPRAPHHCWGLGVFAITASCAPGMMTQSNPLAPRPADP